VVLALALSFACLAVLTAPSRFPAASPASGEPAGRTTM
jgi:hypothetical protein